MIDIQWKGKIGYGDIVSPICYAHNISYKLNTKVNLTFRWDHGPLHLIHPKDPEALWVRASYLFMHCRKHSTDVTMQHQFDNPLDINHTNYDWDIVANDPFHNVWFPDERLKRRVRDNVFVVNSTEGNYMTLEQYKKGWKDPVASGWPDVVEALQQRGKVFVVDYRTPIETLCEYLKSATCFIGYHGTAAWVARFMQVPSIIYSQGKSLTRTSFNAAVVKQEYEGASALVDDLDNLLQRARMLVVHQQQQYNKYTPSMKLIRSLSHGI